MHGWTRHRVHLLQECQQPATSQHRASHCRWLLRWGTMQPCRNMDYADHYGVLECFFFLVLYTANNVVRQPFLFAALSKHYLCCTETRDWLVSFFDDMKLVLPLSPQPGATGGIHCKLVSCMHCQVRQAIGKAAAPVIAKACMVCLGNTSWSTVK